MTAENDYIQRWQSAQKHGQESEVQLARYLRKHAENPQILARLGVSDPLSSIRVHSRKRVESLLGGRPVPPKADIVALSGEKQIGISVKRSREGQLDLRTVQSFSRVLEEVYEYPANSFILRSLEAFVGSTDASVVNNITLGGMRFRQDGKRARLGIFEQTLYLNNEVERLLEWLANGMHFIAQLGFVSGTAKSGHATHIWYYNEETDLNVICRTNAIIASSREFSAFPTAIVGTDIPLPFGAISAHQGCIQIRHSLSKISALGIPLD